MSVDDLLDDWDENFIKDIIQVELDATSSRDPAASSSVPFEPGVAISAPFQELEDPISVRSRITTTSQGFPASIVPLWEEEGGKGAIKTTLARLEKQPNTGRSLTSLLGLDGGAMDEDGCFSPPRELSQRFLEKPESSTNSSYDCEIVEPLVSRNGGHGARGGGGFSKDVEIERLKKELGRVSKKLNHTEHECVELRKDKSKKDAELKCAFSQIEAKDAEISSLKRVHFGSEAPKQDHFQSSLQHYNTSISTNQVGNVDPISGSLCTRRNPQAWAGAETQLYVKSKKVVGPSEELLLEFQKYENYGTKRKDAHTGLFAVSELKHHTATDKNLMTSRGRFVEQESSLPIESVPSHYTKDKGIQTEVEEDCRQIAVKDQLSVQRNISIKLTAIWGSPRRSKQNLVSKLFVTCSADFCALFRCMPAEINLCSRADESLSDSALHEHWQSIQSVEAAKVSRLYIILMKMRNEMAQLDNLLEALNELCLLENAVIVHISMRILHAILRHMLSFDISSDKRLLLNWTRGNDKRHDIDECTMLRDHFVTSPSHNYNFHKSIGPNIQTGDYNKSENAHNGDKNSGLCPSSVRFFDLEHLCNTKDRSSNDGTILSLEHWISLFETMHQITVRHTEEHIRVEAISIMNLILVRSNPIDEREKFGLLPLFESLPLLLRKEIGLQVQKQAVRLLFLLLNCPKLLTMLYGGHKEDVEHSDTDADEIPSLTLHGVIDGILEGLAECMACKGNGTQELKLRKDAIIMFAFMASSSKSGFNILLRSVTTQGISVLELIIQVLASEMVAETADVAESPNICKERTSLIREALILLNRLASNAAYSKAILGVLTSSQATASLTIDVANRMARSRDKWKLDSINKIIQSKEVEIEDLARLFRTRVLSFLGENTT